MNGQRSLVELTLERHYALVGTEVPDTGIAHRQMVLRGLQQFAVIALNLLHREGVDGHFAQGETIQRTHGHIADHLLDHIKVVLFHLTPITRNNLPVRDYIEIHANFSTERSALRCTFGRENGERIGRLPLEEDLTHGTLVRADVVDELERREARGTAEIVLPVVENDIDHGGLFMIADGAHVKNLALARIQHLLVFLQANLCAEIFKQALIADRSQKS